MLGNGNASSVPVLELHPIKQWLVWTDGVRNQRLTKAIGTKFSDCPKGMSINLYSRRYGIIKKICLRICHFPPASFKYWITSRSHKILSVYYVTFFTAVSWILNFKHYLNRLTCWTTGQLRAFNEEKELTSHHNFTNYWNSCWTNTHNSEVCKWR